MISKNNIFSESRQQIIFDDAWQVIAVDKHKHYKTLSGQGLKCVDYLALDKDFGLLMIELKNYDGRPIPNDLHEVFKEKCKDTEQLVRVINKFLKRKLLYQFFFVTLKLKSLVPREWVFWEEVERCIQEQRVLKLLDVQE